jgi:hypothetical protein
MDQDDFETWLSDRSDEAVHVAGTTNPTTLRGWLVLYFTALKDLATQENEIEESDDDEDEETIPLADDEEED